MTRHSKKRGKSYQQLLPGGLAGENVFTRALRCWLRGLLLILLLEIPGPFALVERSGPECAEATALREGGSDREDLGTVPFPSLVDPPSLVPGVLDGMQGLDG